MLSALSDLKAKIRTSTKPAVDPVHQRERMKLLSQPVRNDGRKKKKKLKR